jgi:hypothetical protein
MRVASIARPLLLFVTIVLGGCASLGGGAPPPSLERAEALELRGEMAAAATEFERLAAQNPPASAWDLRLRAARAWLVAGRPGDARRVLAATDAEVAAGYAPSPSQRLLRELARIDLVAAEDQPQAAWAQLGAVTEPTEADLRESYLELRQRLAFATARSVDAIRAEIARENLARTPEARSRLRRELFAQLRSASERGIKLDPAAAGRDSVLRGWLELGPLAAAAAQRGGVAPALAAWRARYPGHPASELVRAETTAATSSAVLGVAGHVAVLLPLSGRAAAAAAQVRDGLQAAVFGEPEWGRPELRFYDTEQLGVAAALDEAVRAGADFVIGPLLREEVIAAADAATGSVEILALNYLPAERPAPEGFFQYALSPEDDARLAARRVLADGHRRGVALVPEGDWGARVLAAFRDEFQRGGGVLLSAAQYAPGSHDYSAAIQDVLRLSESRARERRLESLLGTTFEFLPRRRGDIDFLFAPAPAATARLLRPQVRFHYAGDIPAYATSDAYEPGLTANQDLEGLIFPDMPWVLSGGAAVDRLRAATQAAYSEAARTRGKLYAFGHDAWLLAATLRARGTRDFSGIVVDGATGQITLDADGRSRRELEWAQIRNGTPRLLAGAPD